MIFIHRVFCLFAAPSPRFLLHRPVLPMPDMLHPPFSRRLRTCCRSTCFLFQVVCCLALIFDVFFSFAPEASATIASRQSEPSR